MERHKCKLCSRTFGNGRALGGHMKAHLATIKSQKQQFTQFASFSSSSSESESEHEEEKTLINYVLRENPKKSLKIADPEFSFIPDQTESVIVQDRESETESKNNPTRQQRSKRNRNQNNNNSKNFPERKKSKSSFMMLTTPSTFNDQEPVSSVSDTSPEEDVAMCLMMLSRDKWSREMNINNVVEEEGSVEKTSKLLKRVRGKHLCENCRKSFRSSRALGSHRSVCCRDEAKNGNNDDKIFECPFCFKVFGSGQALGGHKRSHLMIPSSSTSTANANANANANADANANANVNVDVNVDASVRFKESFIDLNLPAPLEEEEDDLSVVSEA
ncbi:hypothetical protein TSUD_156150 [Trifolium subterraneum]|uniref:C2H2-type domain-containing protein n=1 Tax=Trifolium subterraneum TaxID=3900 RepID=A0A2Z6M2Z4_TRISU|nr:hypothetical protein TSUD_156150 [Trifolium subterraneum]